MPKQSQVTPAKLASPADAIAAAQEFAAAVAPSAVRRDREQVLPVEEVELLRKSGLLAAAVPTRFGGADANTRTMAEIIRIIATVDPGLAIIPQSHFNLAEGARLSPDQANFREFVFNEMLAGNLFGNAGNERNTPRPMQTTALLTHDGSGTLRLNGEKFYTTGCIFAKWIVAVAKAQHDGEKRLCMVKADAPGITILDDWRASGQRSASCGTVTFQDTPVIEELTRPFNDNPDRIVPWSQILHAAVPAGIARGALDELVAFTRDHARPSMDSPYTQVSLEPHVITTIGLLAVEVDVAEAYLEKAAGLVDAARDRPSQQRLDAARIAVAGTKTFSTQVALKVANAAMEFGGTRAAMQENGIDRHWRNVQTQSSHNVDRWLRFHIGNYLLNDIDLPKNGKI